MELYFNGTTFQLVVLLPKPAGHDDVGISFKWSDSELNLPVMVMSAEASPFCHGEFYWARHPWP